MKALLKISPLIIVVLFIAAGCINVNRNFKEVSTKLINKFGNDYHREIEASVGPFLINFASWVVNFSQEDEIVDDLMRQVTNVQVGVYTMTNDRKRERSSVMEKINIEMQSRGWRYIVRSYGNEELTAIYISSDPEMFFKKLFIITHDSEQLVLVEVEGKLDRLIELAIHDKKFKFDI
ncbi:MAG: hypothetical protein A2V93_03300 [Ignavibacteria bacterium RBG_16_34_14]|nr:MAG: hypothetical protein A2V93_03300 [Ignavibacteria bacterium RBG_16_34_14]